MKKQTYKWYRVDFEGCFYDDMVGKLILEEDRTMRLDFGGSVGNSKFFKEQLVFEDEF